MSEKLKKYKAWELLPEEKVCLAVEVYKAISELNAKLEEKDNEIAELKQEIEQLKKENEMTLVGVNLRSHTSDGRFV